MERENGGPAFPVPGDQHFDSFSGMSMRDYFATMAMSVVDGALGREDFARHCYALADAMLAERSK